jgi:hypothetical protein
MMKKPGILAWIGFIVLALVILILLVIIGSFMGKSTQTSTVSSVSGGASDGARMMAPSYEAAPTAPSYLADNTIEAIKSETNGLGTAAPAGTTDTQTTQQVIKTGEISLRVTDASKAVDDINALATGKGGFVESSSISDSGTGPRNAWVTIRVPVTAFDDAMKALKQIGVLVLDVSVHGQDVTQEFVDLNADLTNAKAEEQSYLDILKRTGSIEDVLAVTARLADVRGRIERLQGTQRYLENRTDLATIAVSLTEETRVEVPSRTWKPLEVVRTALSDLVASLQALVDFLIRLVIGLIGLLLPIALLTFLSIWIIWKIAKAVIRRFRR